MEHNLVFPTYEEIHEKSVKLAELIKDKNINFTKMVVVSRGGFVPASVGTGMDFGGVFVATIIAAVIGCLIMGLWANWPIALAPGMGLKYNSFF